ncbi:unnamed protein product [Brassica oleracea]
MLRALVRPLEWWCSGSRGSGHGGPEASKFVNRHLFPYIHIHKFAREEGGLSADVIKRAFKETEEDFCNM